MEDPFNIRGTILRRQHQHQKVQIGVFTFYAILPQTVCQLSAGHTGWRLDSQAQRVRRLYLPSGSCQRLPRFVQTHAHLPQAFPVPIRQVAVAQIQRRQSQIGRAGRAKHGHCRFCVLPQRRRRCTADMKVRAAGQHRQRLVRRIAAQSCTQIQRVAGWLQKPQIGAVGVIHRQQCAVLPAHLRQSGNVRHAAQIVRTGEIDRRRRRRQLRQRPLQCVRRYRTAAERGTSFRPQPDDLKIQQGRRVQERAVYVPGGHDRPGSVSADQGQI